MVVIIGQNVILPYVINQPATYPQNATLF